MLFVPPFIRWNHCFCCVDSCWCSSFNCKIRVWVGSCNQMGRNDRWRLTKTYEKHESWSDLQFCCLMGQCYSFCVGLILTQEAWISPLYVHIQRDLVLLGLCWMGYASFHDTWSCLIPWREGKYDRQSCSWCFHWSCFYFRRTFLCDHANQLPLLVCLLELLHQCKERQK